MMSGQRKESFKEFDMTKDTFIDKDKCENFK